MGSEEVTHILRCLHECAERALALPRKNNCSRDGAIFKINGAKRGGANSGPELTANRGDPLDGRVYLHMYLSNRALKVPPVRRKRGAYSKLEK